MMPDAIFCINGPVAVGAFQRINEAGLKIPGDAALVGFSNNKIASLINPQMTTIDQPSFDMGRGAAALLIDATEKKVTEPTTIVLDTRG